MRADRLLSCLSLAWSSERPIPVIERITERSSEADARSLFVCIKGYRSDGHAYAADAYRRGCRCFLAEEPLSLPSDATVLYHPNTHASLGLLASHFYGDPSHGLSVIGITGTKGKTTTACLLASILNGAGIACGYIGTNGIQYGDRQIETKNTTPDAITLQKTLADMRDFGCRAVVLEVSSQAVLLERIAGMRFATCLFTNLSHDHVGAGEHPDFDNYVSCKRRLFTDYGAETVIVNQDDAFSSELLSICKGRCVTCSIERTADYQASAIDLTRKPAFLGVSFVAEGGEEEALARLPLLGKFNASNALLAMACARECFGVSLRKSAFLLESARISGRSEVIPLANDALAVIDYAHNGMSLERLLLELRAYAPHRLLCLFGSVGERTQLRRHELGRAAAAHADLCILTSDNPGREPVMQILSEIAEVFEGTDTPYLTIPDRAEAIRHALGLLQSGDILVLAGKGHETTQVVGGEALPFSERQILLDALEELYPSQA